MSIREKIVEFFCGRDEYYEKPIEDHIEHCKDLSLRETLAYSSQIPVYYGGVYVMIDKMVEKIEFLEEKIKLLENYYGKRNEKREDAFRSL